MTTVIKMPYNEMLLYKLQILYMSYKVYSASVRKYSASDMRQLMPQKRCSLETSHGDHELCSFANLRQALTHAS